MKRKGRVQAGADADLVVFDPSTIADRATYRDPTVAPAGINWVVVNGTIVVRRGAVAKGVAPGVPIRAPIRAR
jgi:N-acyl-D-aspartate/D-glutamate deacylase